MMDAKLYQQCTEMQLEFMNLWQRLVSIDTGSRHGEGIKQMAVTVAEFLKSLGVDTEIIPTADPAEGSHVIGVLKGSGSGKVLAMAHMDTVFAPGTAADRPFTIRDGWVYGPGVSDCKGGVVLCLYALKLLQTRRFTDFEQITCLFNCDEEIGSPDSRRLVQKLAPEHDYTLCLEPGQVGDGVVVSRKGGGNLQVEAYGKTSHAGSNPENGRNAIMELIQHVTALSKLEDPAKETTVNFTVIKGGDRTNVIPDYAVAKADIRVVDPAEFERIERTALELTKETLIPGTTVKVTVQCGNPPFPQNAGTDALIAKAQAIYRELGKTLILNKAGGASDANWAAAAGASVLDGLGPVKGGANHTENECTKLDSVVPRLYLLTRLFMELGAGKGQR